MLLSGIQSLPLTLSEASFMVPFAGLGVPQGLGIYTPEFIIRHDSCPGWNRTFIRRHSLFPAETKAFSIDRMMGPQTAADAMDTDIFSVEIFKLLTDVAEFNEPVGWHAEATSKIHLSRPRNDESVVTIPFDPEYLDWKLTVGRGSQSEVQFKSNGISRRHMSLESRGGFFYVKRLAKSPVWVNGKKLSKGEEYLLDVGSRVALGIEENQFEFNIEHTDVWARQIKKEKNPRVFYPQLTPNPGELSLVGRPKQEFFPITRVNDQVLLGPSLNHSVVIPTTLEHAEVFIGKEKCKYTGSTKLWINLKKEKVIEFTDEKTGVVHLFALSEIVGLRMGDHLYSFFNNIDNPQYADKSFNQSGVDGMGMRVLVDFSDKRLTDFMDSNILPIARLLEEGEIDPYHAACFARTTIQNKVEYDKPRTYDRFENRLYNLGEFTIKAVCNERAMLLQLALQYLGIRSYMEKGRMPNGGRHAWVRVLDKRFPHSLILDPQQKSPLVPWDARFMAYEDDKTDFILEEMESVGVEEENGRPQLISKRPSAHWSWNKSE